MATTYGNLKKHKDSKHKGIRYPCDQCDFSATTLSNLKAHKNAKHLGIRFPCDKCEYSANQRQSLKRHKKSKHNIVEEDSGDMKKGMGRRVPKETKGSITELMQEVGCRVVLVSVSIVY